MDVEHRGGADRWLACARRGRSPRALYVDAAKSGGDQITNTIEQLHEELGPRVKTRGSLSSEDAALVLLFSPVFGGEMKLHRIDGWRKIAAVLSQHTAVAA